MFWGREASREALGDDWRIIEGQLGEHLGQVKGKNDDMQCDMMMRV